MFGPSQCSSMPHKSPEPRKLVGRVLRDVATQLSNKTQIITTRKNIMAHYDEQREELQERRRGHQPGAFLRFVERNAWRLMPIVGLVVVFIINFMRG